MDYTQTKQVLSQPRVMDMLAVGTIITPFGLIEEIVDKLPVQWDNPGLKILDPACGRGAFLVVIKQKLLKHHSEQHIIENMLYGNDIAPKNAAIAVAALTASKYKHNITVGDSLTKGWGMKFDVIVGNPPYQSTTTGADPLSNRVSGKRTLYDKFIEKAMELAPVWALVVPSFWLGRTTHKLYKQALPRCDIIINTTRYFPQVTGVPTCALIAHSQPKQTVTMIDIHSVDVARGDVMGFMDDVTRHIINKIRSADIHLDTIHFQSNQYIRSKIIQGGDKFPIVDITGPTTLNIPQYIYSTVPLLQLYTGTHRLVLNWNGSVDGIGAIKYIGQLTAPISASCVALCCNSECEALELLRVIRSKLYKFVVKAVKTSATNNKATFRYLPMVDLTRSWTDQELYQHFNLTQEEIDLIEATIK